MGLLGWVEGLLGGWVWVWVYILLCSHLVITEIVQSTRSMHHSIVHVVSSTVAFHSHHTTPTAQ